MSGTSDHKSQVFFDTALESYERQTGMKLVDHPLARQFEVCRSVDSIMDVLQQQARAFFEFRGDDSKLKKAFKRSVHILYALSTSISVSGGVGLPFPPAMAVFSGLAVLFTVVKDLSASYDALIDLLETIEQFLTRLEVYTELPTTAAMGEIIVKIMGELLFTIALVTKQIQQRRPLKFVKRLLGENEVEAVLRRIDRLTVEEARLTVAHTLGVVLSLVQNVRAVMDDGKASTSAIRDALGVMQTIASKINKLEREKLQEDIARWLSPPDPWKNHNTAYQSRSIGTSTWFIEGSTFSKWKSTSSDSLLWIHGIPGAGKSVISSTIVEDINELRKQGLASLGFFYCDFRDDDKRKLRGLVSSLIVQLSGHSDPYSTILSGFYSENDRGRRDPSDDSLIRCLKDMLALPDQAPIYLVIDGLDECPNTFGTMPTHREKILMFVQELVELCLQNLCICITSRLEVDITTVFDPLHFNTVILHEERGQRQDIMKYVNSVVNTDLKMRGWRTEDRELVIKVVTTTAQGMFRWAFCQLDFLRRCLPGRIRQALDELPESLDGTYKRILKDIDKANWKFAHRIFQCVAVASRPIFAEELADLLAFDFDAGSTPAYRAGWRPEDPVGAVLSTCSSLLAVVENVGGSEIIQFSHFSVKEFLISTRLAEDQDAISRYHVSMTPAHTLVAQACLSILLHLDEDITNDSLKDFPFAEYAAEYWVDHARFLDVTASIQHEMKPLFDPKRPHLAICVWIFDPLRPSFPWFLRRSRRSELPSPLRGGYLHYAAFLGFHDLIPFLVDDCEQDVIAPFFDQTRTPLHAAAIHGRVEFGQMLIERGVDVNAQDVMMWTALHLTCQGGHVEFGRVLIEHGAQVGAQEEEGLTPLHLASMGGRVKFGLMLVEHGADVNSQDLYKWTPLHLACAGGHVEFAKMLIKQGVKVNSKGNNKVTPLHIVSRNGHVELARVLIKRGADVNPQDNNKSIPLHLASKSGHLECVRMLVEHGADVNSQDNDNFTPLHLASQGGHVKSGQVLLKHGAVVNTRGNYKWTPLNLSLKGGHVEFARVLIKYNADVNAQGNDKLTPLHLALTGGHMDFARELIPYGVDVNVQDREKGTPLHLALKGGHTEFAQVLVNHGADINAQDNYNRSPLYLALDGGHVEFARMLVEHGADINAQDNSNWSPLHLALDGGHMDIVRELINHGADVTAQDKYGSTLIHLAVRGGHVKIARRLIENGADVNAQDSFKSTPLNLALKGKNLELARELVVLGADVNVQDTDKRTPLHFALDIGNMAFLWFLIEHGADIDAQDNCKSTPLHRVSLGGHAELARVLIENGANVNTQDCEKLTPLHFASLGGHMGLARELIKNGADVNSQDCDKLTPLHLGSLGGRAEFAKMLAENGADVNAQDCDKLTPSHLASLSGHMELVEVLVGYGADMNAHDA